MPDLTLDQIPADPNEADLIDGDIVLSRRAGVDVKATYREHVPVAPVVSVEVVWDQTLDADHLSDYFFGIRNNSNYADFNYMGAISYDPGTGATANQYVTMHTTNQTGNRQWQPASQVINVGTVGRWARLVVSASVASTDISTEA